MKKYLFILAALLTLGTLSSKAQTQTETTATCGETVVITATPDSGYTFLYWEDDHTLTDSIREVTITSELDLYNYVAVFTKNQTYTLSVTSDDTTMGTVTGGDGNYEAGTEVEIKADPVSKCYRFKQWSDGNTNATRTVKVTDKAATNTYVAYFEQVEFTVKVTTAVGGKVTIARK